MRETHSKILQKKNLILMEEEKEAFGLITQKISFKEPGEKGWGIAYLEAQRERYLTEEDVPASMIDTPSKLIELILAEHECLLKERNEILDQSMAAVDDAQKILEDVSSNVSSLGLDAGNEMGR